MRFSKIIATVLLLMILLLSWTACTESTVTVPPIDSKSTMDTVYYDRDSNYTFKDIPDSSIFVHSDGRIDTMFIDSNRIHHQCCYPEPWSCPDIYFNQTYPFYASHFNTETIVLVTWADASLDDFIGVELAVFDFPNQQYIQGSCDTTYYDGGTAAFRASCYIIPPLTCP